MRSNANTPTQIFKNCDERIRNSLRKKREETRQREAELLLIDDEQDGPPNAGRGLVQEHEARAADL